ncbi:MAG: RtcB family protein [Dehalococcoidia bacterium]|jgi:tRNA-splicing ligase RtcB|nr:RtcB family protein [Dehalococcoidia bacterium]
MTTLRRLDDYRWEIPVDYKAGMRVPGLVYMSAAMVEVARQDEALEQVANVAFLPGIVGKSLAMPDIHSGYGFPIGGVAATRVSDGVVSPGGVGYDINCGVRLLRSDLLECEVAPHMISLIDHLFRNVPSGVGSEGRLRPPKGEITRLLVEGARWAVRHGFGTADDLEATEDGGCIQGADPSAVSERALTRGLPQAGSLGSGNHFLEIQAVREIFDEHTAAAMGIDRVGQVLVLIHTGSRGLGHQVCTDHLKVMERAVFKYGILLPDRQLACAPVESPEGREYLAAMRCAANYAWCNRQHITHWVRESFTEVFGLPSDRLGLRQVYDIAHNIAKIETHKVDGRDVSLCVHRKGATRAFPPGHPALSPRFKAIGQPVLIPGDMGRYSYIAVGTERAMQDTFGSTCHGAGRLLSRTAARKAARGYDVAEALRSRAITVRTDDVPALAEEASGAYKDVADVVDVVVGAGICRRVARAEPLGVIKG